MSDLKHMDIASRNQRLRETLEGMGLFVQPVFSAENPDAIDHMLVSATLPLFVQKGAKNAASGSVAPPVTRSEIVSHIGPTDAARDVVIDFPAKLR